MIQRIIRLFNAPYFALTEGETLCNGYAMLTYNEMLKELGYIPDRLIQQEQQMNWSCMEFQFDVDGELVPSLMQHGITRYLM